MKSRFDSGFSSTDRAFIDRLHIFLFAKRVHNTGCSDCWRDAYIEVVAKLKKDQRMPQEPNYILKNGAVLHPYGTSKFYTNPLPSDDVAEEYLSKFPQSINLFAKFPYDWEKRVAKYLKRLNGEGEEDEPEQENTELTTLRNDNAELQKVLSEAKAEAENLRGQVETLNSELSAAKEEVNSLKVEIRGLKSANTRLKNAAEKKSESKAEPAAE